MSSTLPPQQDSHARHPTSPLHAAQPHLHQSPSSASSSYMLLRALVHPSVAVFVALAPPVLSAVGRSTSPALAALVPHVAHAVLIALAGVYLYLIVQVPWDLYQVAARRADALALLESTSTGSGFHGLSNPTTPNTKQQPATSRSASASSTSAAASCTIHATFTLHPPDGPARWLARGAFAMALASPIIGSALLLAVKSRLRDAWWIPLELLDPVPFALAASIRPLLHLAASAARAAASSQSLDAVSSDGVAGARESLTRNVSPAAAVPHATAETYSNSSRAHQQQHHHQHAHPHSHPRVHTHVHRAARFSDGLSNSDIIPATWLPHLNPSTSDIFDPNSIPSHPSSWTDNSPSFKSVHTHLAALRSQLALHLKHLDAALEAASSPPQAHHSSSSLSPRPSSSFSILTSLLGSPSSWLSAHLPRPSMHVSAYLPAPPPIRTWATWLLLGWLRWIVACIVLPLAAWITMIRATWWVLTLVPKQVIRHAIEAPPPTPVLPSGESRRRRRGSVPANDELAAEAPAPATSAAPEDAGGSTSLVEDTASLVDALLSRVLPAAIYSAPVHHVQSKQRHASPAPVVAAKSGAAAGGRSRTRSRGARVSQLRPLSAPVAGATAEANNGEHKRPVSVAAQ